MPALLPALLPVCLPVCLIAQLYIFQRVQWRRFRVCASEVCGAVCGQRDGVPQEEQEDVRDPLLLHKQIPGELYTY